MTFRWCAGWRRMPHAAEDVQNRTPAGIPLCAPCELQRLREAGDG